jgi:ABC-2 type transport system ATP-binding protein
VDRVSFDAFEGEVLGLLGPNGAGKTSAIRALTTVLPTDAGDARVAGFELSAATEIRARIGSLPESSGHPGTQTAHEYLRYHGRLYGLDKVTAADRARRLLDEMGLGDHSAIRIRTFSRGMRQRLGIARCLINSPEVLFLDEPTLGLDPAGQGLILQCIRDIGDHTTVILSSHLLDEVERVCDRVVIMNKGSVVAAGTVDEVVASSGVSTSVRVRVPLPDLDRATALLRNTPGVAAVTDDGRPGELAVEVGAAPNLVAAALIDSAIPLLSLQMEGGTLQDAFLSLTTRRGSAA